MTLRLSRRSSVAHQRLVNHRGRFTLIIITILIRLIQTMVGIEVPTRCTVVFHAFQRPTKELTHVRTPLTIGTGARHAVR